LSPPIWFLILAWLLISLPYYSQNSHLQELRWNLIKIIKIMHKSQNHQNHDVLAQILHEAGSIRQSQCWGLWRSSVVSWSSLGLHRLVLVAEEFSNFWPHFDTLFLIEISSSFWKSCLKASRLGRCTRSELNQVLWTSLIILQLVLAPGDHQNPSFLATFFVAHLLVVSCHFSMSSEALFMILRFPAIYWNLAAKLAFSASDICPLETKLKIWPTQCLRGWLGLSSDGSCWYWFFIVVVSAWSQSISMLAFPWFPFDVEIPWSSSEELQLDFLRWEERTRNSANASPCSLAAAI